MAKALVTGAGGFVGANLVRHLAVLGHQPLAAIRPGGNPWRLEGYEGARVELDLAHADDVRAAVLEHRPDWIFHLAAHGAYSWQRDVGAMLAVNVACTEALLAAAREAGTAGVVHAGSSSEYGLKDHAPREDEAVSPNSHYAVMKVAGTHLCRLAAAQHGQRAVTLRLYSAYGPWEEPGRLLPTLVHRALAGGWPPLVGPETARDFVYVDDVCDAFVRAAEQPLDDPGAVFNLGSGTQTTLAQLVEVAGDLFGVVEEPVWGTMEQRSWDTTLWVSDPSAIGQALGWQATTSLREGLAALAQWMGAQPDGGARFAPKQPAAGSA
jgi:nucleoside-diphosphate-sugar epimerase